MKKISLITFFLLNTLLYSQKNKTYLIEFNSLENVPIVNKSKKINYKTKQNILELNFNSKEEKIVIEVFKFEKEFPNFNTPSLQNVWRILVSDENVIKLLIEKNLIQKHIELPEDILLNENNFAIPNDYYLNPDVSGHTFLDLINAQEAWFYSTGNGILLGVPDFGFNLSHLELKDKITCLTGSNCSSSLGGHGSQVSSLVAAETNNSFGNSSIGYNANMIAANGTSVANVKAMSDQGAKAINMSWISWGGCSYNEYYQLAVNEIVAQGTVLVAAAGNSSTCGGPTNYVYPASYENVISVSGVGHSNDIGSGAVYYLKDVHLMNISPKASDGEKTQHNDKVDLVAPAYYLGGLPGQYGATSKSRCWNGTSCSSPLVTGTIGLMSEANNCISPKEIETILKITSANIDQISYNQPYAGLLGAGRLDAGLAVKAAYRMKNNQLVKFSDKKINRWNLKLDNTLYELDLENVELSGNVDANFIAEKSISISNNTLLAPSTNSNKSIFLNVDGVSNSCFIPDVSINILPKITSTNEEDSKNLKNGELINVYPTLFDNYVFLKNEDKKRIILNVIIYDLNKRIVFRQNNIISKEEILNLNKLKKGLYFIEVYSNKNKVYRTKLFKH
jgi:hypothetical protein